MKYKDPLITCRLNIRDAFIIEEIYKCTVYKLEKFVKTPINNFVDIGAHIGAFTVKAHSRFPDAIGYSFEPNKDNFEVLKINTNRSDNLHIFNKAVYGDKKPTDLYDCPLTREGISVYNYKDTDEVNNNLYSIETLQDELEYIDLLKIDCEGGEHSIFEKLDFTKVGYLLCEFHTEVVHGNPKFKPFFKWLLYIEQFMDVVYREKMNEDSYNFVGINKNLQVK